MIEQISNIFIHLDKFLPTVYQQYGTWVYVILFCIIFIETGFVFFPFLPGDSLLFAAGALSAATELNTLILWAILVVAAVLGDTINYWVGYKAGEYITSHKWIDQSKLDKTSEFFKKYGGNAVILGRFVPIIRTFVPFVAGMSKMPYRKFTFYNILGAFIWVSIGIFAGYFFANLPFVKDNFSAVVIGIIIISLIPIVGSFIRFKLFPSKD